MESLHQVMGPCAMLRDLVSLGVEEILQYDPYEDKSQNSERFPMLDEEPEVTPKGGPICKCRDTAPKRGQDGQRLSGMLDANGNPIGRSNQNPILDTCLYEVEFPGREIAELWLISLQSQCMPSMTSMGMNTYY